MSSLKKIAFAVGFMVAAVFGLCTPAASAQPAAPHVTCHANSCYGQDPVATGCANDAQTYRSFYIKNLDLEVEARWSPTCQSAWARAGSCCGPVGTLSIGQAPQLSQSTSISAGYTRMIVWAGGPRACVDVTNPMGTPFTCTPA
jgi:hypothetical protein